MPVPFVNFTNAPTSVSPLTAIEPGIENGLKLSMAMQQAKQQQQLAQKQQQALDMANALAKLQLQNAPDKFSSDLANKNAMTGYYQTMAGAIPEKNDIARTKNQLLLESLKQKLMQPSALDREKAINEQKSQLKAQSNDAAALSKLISEASDESETSNNLINYAKAFDAAYGKNSFLETGPYLGKIKAVSSSAQNTDRNSNLMVSQIMNLLKGNRVTNSQLAFLQTLKPSRLLNPESERSAISQVIGGASRGAEQLPFIMYAKSKGLNAQDIQLLWAKYSSEKPIYNPEKGLINKENLNSWKSYIDDFAKSGGIASDNMELNPNQIQNLAKFLDNSGAKTEKLGGSTKAAEQTLIPKAAPGKIIIRDPEGKYHEIDANKLDEAKKRAKIEVISNG